jgi:hypothetical protein
MWRVTQKAHFRLECKAIVQQALSVRLLCPYFFANFAKRGADQCPVTD